MSGFHWWIQRDLLAPYVDEFFAKVKDTFDKRENEFTRSYFANLFPGYRVEREILGKSEALLGSLFFGVRDKVKTPASRECQICGDDLGKFVAFFAYDKRIAFGRDRLCRRWIICKDNWSSIAKRFE